MASARRTADMISPVAQLCRAASRYIESGKTSIVWVSSANDLFNEKYFSYGVYTGFPTYAALPAPERTLFVSGQYTFQ